MLLNNLKYAHIRLTRIIPTAEDQDVYIREKAKVESLFNAPENAIFLVEKAANLNDSKLIDMDESEQNQKLPISIYPTLKVIDDPSPDESINTTNQLTEIESLKLSFQELKELFNASIKMSNMNKREISPPPINQPSNSRDTKTTKTTQNDFHVNNSSTATNLFQNTSRFDWDSKRSTTFGQDTIRTHRNYLKPTQVKDWHCHFWGKDTRIPGDLSLLEFLTNVRKLAIRNNIDLNFVVSQIGCLLKGPAETLYNNMQGDPFPTWKDFELQIKKQYLPATFQYELFEQIQTTKQSSDQGVGEYISEMRKLFNTLPLKLDEEQQCFYIKRGLMNNIKLALASKTCHTIDDLERAAKTAVTTLNSMKETENTDHGQKARKMGFRRIRELNTDLSSESDSSNDSQEPRIQALINVLTTWMDKSKQVEKLKHVTKTRIVPQMQETRSQSE